MEKQLDKIFQLLSSVKFTIVILFGLGLAAIPGTLVDPQKSTYDFYHSWWFTALLFLLTLNLIVCTFYRKQTRVSVWMVHCSIFFILVGGIIGSRLGFRTNLNLEDGETASTIGQERSLKKIPLPFEIRSDAFRLRYYEDSMRPSDFESDLVILEDGKPVLGKTIRVNDPLRYKGISFYQASYGAIPKGFAIKIKDQSTGKILQEAQMGFDSPIRIAAAGQTMKVIDYTSDFEGFGPAALVAVEKPQAPAEQWVVFKNYPNFESKQRGRYLPILSNVETSYYTGLQVVKDPGVPLVYTGFCLLILGLALGFFSPQWRSLKLFDKKPKVEAQINPAYVEVESP